MGILEKIDSREAVIAVIGLGYVGLPVSVAFAEAGFRVLGIDTSADLVARINAGRTHVGDVSAERVAAGVSHGRAGPGGGAHGAAPRLGSLAATTDYGALTEADAAIICVPTPLSKTKDPDLSYVLASAEGIAARLHPGMLVVLESTTYPGTTEELILPLLERGGQGRRPMKAGVDFYLGFSPERIDPGRSDRTFRDTPKVIGGTTPKCLEVACKLYGSVIERVVPVSSPRVAEMVKLLENTFRAVNIGLVNEMAIMCDRLGIDVWEVIEAAGTKPFGFMTFYPGPGLGGHCLPIDPLYLAWKLKTLNYNARFIQLAAEINFSMPEYVLDKVRDALNSRGQALKGARVLVLGVTYKADVSDIREAPALDLMKLLQEKGSQVRYHDPYVPRLDVDGRAYACVTLDDAALAETDCVVIATAHGCYDWQWIVDRSAIVVDTRNATKAVRPPPGVVFKL